jgi:Trk-type K+ transport system membrane component
MTGHMKEGIGKMAALPGSTVAGLKFIRVLMLLLQYLIKFEAMLDWHTNPHHHIFYQCDFLRK